MKQILFFSIFFLFIFSLECKNLVSRALGSHMVLQRAPQRANIWGFVNSDENVTVTFNNKIYRTQGNPSKSGYWNVFLDPTNSGGPYIISVVSGALSVTLSDVFFGDVFVCGGQSNMQFTVHQGFNASDEIQDANNYPFIRVFTVGQSTTSPSELFDFQNIEQPWSIASAGTIGIGDWNAFSAVCWFYGKNLYKTLKVPIGLISDNWGGTPVQAWSSAEALTKCKAMEPPPSRVEGPNDPTQLWNAMIVPILPMTITGAIWYQGESNAGQPNYYACAFPAMISDWRERWGGETKKDFGFYFVQLAPWKSTGDGEPLTRLAQLYATKLPNVGVATAIDVGDPTSPFGDIHPRNKQIVGDRLYLISRALTYGEKIQYKGPEATGWKILTSPPTASVIVDFAIDSIGDGLTLVTRSCSTTDDPRQCGWYEIGTTDGKWTNATATIQGNSIKISANLPSGVTINGVRYGWANYPVATLYNKNGLPALPFAFPNPINPSYVK